MPFLQAVERASRSELLRCRKLGVACGNSPRRRQGEARGLDQPAARADQTRAWSTPEHVPDQTWTQWVIAPLTRKRHMEDTVTSKMVLK